LGVISRRGGSEEFLRLFRKFPGFIAYQIQVQI
jgi:hypothetical protein